jgi:hypothetical protein
MSLVSELTGKEVEPLMLKTFPLAVPGMKKPPGFQRAATVQPSLPQSPVLLDRHIRRQSVMPSTNGTPPSLPEVESQKDLARFRTWAKNAITGQQKDIDRIQGTVSRIEKDMSSFKDFMQEVRIELATSGQSRHLLNEGQAAIREDMNSLRKQVHTSEQRVALSLEEASQTSKTAWEGVARDVLKVSRKVSEVDSLKDELHNLTTRLQNLENLMGDGPQISQESNEINDVKGDLQYLKIRIESLESGSRGALVSAGGYEVASPEAEHHSTGGAEEPHRRISDTVPGMLSMLARPEAHGTALESTRDASLILRTGSVRWSYTGPQSLRSVRSACVAFGMTRMTRANQPIPRAIEMLEKYVNESQQQNTPNGRVYGMAAPIQVTAAQKRGTPKRPHEEVEALFDEEHSQFAHPKRIRKISAGSAKRNAVAIETSETPDPLQDLPSPPQNSAKIVPPVHNSSPILGDYDNHGEYIYAKDDVDHGYQPALKPKPKDTSKRPVGRRKRVSLTTATPNTAPKRPSRRRKSSLSTAALKNTSNKENETEAPSQTEGPEAADDTILPSIEKDDGFQVRIPPAPPTFEPRTRAFRATAATPATTRQAKPFKCGVCGKQWKNLDGLRYVSIAPLSSIELSAEISLSINGVCSSVNMLAMTRLRRLSLSVRVVARNTCLRRVLAM